MPLSDSAIRAVKPREKPYKLADEKGLYLLISPAGGKHWRLKYRFHDAEKVLSFGSRPEISLKEARQKRDEARRLLENNTDPGAEKKRKAIEARLGATSTFRSVSEDMIAKMEREHAAPATMKKTLWLAAQLYPELGDRPVTEITPMEILEILKKVEKRGNFETARRLSAFASRVFKLAVITGRAKNNPARDLGMALVIPKVKHHAAILEPKALGKPGAVQVRHF